MLYNHTISLGPGYDPMMIPQIRETRTTSCNQQAVFMQTFHCTIVILRNYSSLFHNSQSNRSLSEPPHVHPRLGRRVHGQGYNAKTIK